MAKLTRTQKFADLRETLAHDKEPSLSTKELSDYEDKFNNLTGQTLEDSSRKEVRKVPEEDPKYIWEAFEDTPVDDYEIDLGGTKSGSDFYNSELYVWNDLQEMPKEKKKEAPVVQEPVQQVAPEPVQPVVQEPVKEVVPEPVQPVVQEFVEVLGPFYDADRLQINCLDSQENIALEKRLLSLYVVFVADLLLEKNNIDVLARKLEALLQALLELLLSSCLDHQAIVFHLPVNPCQMIAF